MSTVTQKDYERYLNGKWDEKPVVVTYARTYVGPTEKLQGQEALVRQDPGNQFGWLAQFNGYPVSGDGRALFIGGVNLACGWHPFPKSSFSAD